jgi:hypothetical protein
MADFPSPNSNFIQQFIKLIQMLNVAQMVQLHFWPYAIVAFTKIQNGQLSRQNSKWQIFPPKFRFLSTISHSYSNAKRRTVVKLHFWPYTMVACT